AEELASNLFIFSSLIIIIRLCIARLSTILHTTISILGRLVILPQMNVSGEEGSGRVDYAIKKTSLIVNVSSTITDQCNKRFHKDQITFLPSCVSDQKSSDDRKMDTFLDYTDKKMSSSDSTETTLPSTSLISLKESSDSKTEDELLEVKVSASIESDSLSSETNQNSVLKMQMEALVSAEEDPWEKIIRETFKKDGIEKEREKKTSSNVVTPVKGLRSNQANDYDD
ncbi:6988_t:CDS:2, partial [Funneliformis mosseae]